MMSAPDYSCRSEGESPAAAGDLSVLFASSETRGRFRHAAWQKL